MKNTSVPLLAARLNGRVLFVVSVLLLPASAARGQTTKIVGYIDAGGAPEYMSNLTTSDFSHVITGFISPSSTNGSLGYDSMGTWTWNPQTQTSEYDPTRINAAYATAINAVRASGKKVLLSFGGASGWSGGEPGYSFWSSGTATAQLAAQLANYVTHPAVQAGGPEVSFDGIDIDYEDTAALQGTGYGGTQFLINLTTDLRALLPANQYLITHAPQTPYFLTSFASNGMYQAVNAQVGNLIDFYNIQFYNNPAYDGNGSVAGVVSAYGNILDDNPGLSATKALLGLPMASGLASTNVFSLQDQANIYSQAADTYSGFGGAMGWQVYAGPNTTALGPTWAANAESALVAPVPEPSTYAMAIAGIACGGFSMWRRRKRA